MLHCISIIVAVRRSAPVAHIHDMSPSKGGSALHFVSLHRAAQQPPHLFNPLVSLAFSTSVPSFPCLLNPPVLLIPLTPLFSLTCIPPIPRSAPEHVVKLHRDATAETDPMLQGLELPHEAFFARQGRERGREEAVAAARARCESRGARMVGPGEWPEGLLGYAVNLVRPARQGDRALVFPALMGRSLLFENLDQAVAYRCR